MHTSTTVHSRLVRPAQNPLKRRREAELGRHSRVDTFTTSVARHFDVPVNESAFLPLRLQHGTSRASSTLLSTPHQHYPHLVPGAASTTPATYHYPPVVAWTPPPEPSPTCQDNCQDNSPVFPNPILTGAFQAAPQPIFATDTDDFGAGVNLATEELDKAFDGLRNAFKAFWKHKDATVPMAGVAGACGTGSGFCGSAKIEPRFWRNGWKAGLYMDIVAHVETIRLDILMLWFAMAGSDGKPDGIFAKFNKATEFKSVQDDLNGTLEDAHSLAIAMLKHETGHFTGLNALKTTTGIDDLGALPGLIAHLNKSLKFETKAPESMEDDEICQVSTVCMLLDATIKHIAVLIKGAIKQA